MLYVVAFFCSPLALMLIGKPFQALINAVVWLISGVLALFVFPLGMIPWLLAFAHAGVAIEARNREERRRELNMLLVAQGHKPMIQTEQPDSAVSPLRLLVLLLLVGAAVLALILAATTGLRLGSKKIALQWPGEKKLDAPVQAQPAPAPESAPAAPPPIEGWTFGEVVNTFGEPTSRDKTTGVAIWLSQRPAFQAKFEGGLVKEVSLSK